MKKLLILSLVFILLSLLGNNNPAFYNLKNYNASAEYSFYVAGKVPFDRGYYVINNAGLGSIVTCNVSMSDYVKKQIDSIMGESISFNGDMNDVIKVLNYYKADIVKTEKIGKDIFSIYARSNAFKHGVYVDEAHVNLQICSNAGKITIGTPIILGSY